MSIGRQIFEWSSQIGLEGLRKNFKQRKALKSYFKIIHKTKFIISTK